MMGEKSVNFNEKIKNDFNYLSHTTHETYERTE